MALQAQAASRHALDREMRIGDLAGRVGVGKSHMSLIMSGKRYPSLHVAAKIAQEMGVSLDEFYAKLAEKSETVEALT